MYQWGIQLYFIMIATISVKAPYFMIDTRPLGIVHQEHYIFITYTHYIPCIRFTIKCQTYLATLVIYFDVHFPQILNNIY